MAQARQTKRNFTWAPRALVVISCALALLAVQPTLHPRTAQHGPRPKVVDLGSRGPTLDQAAPRQMPSLGIPSTQARTEVSFFSNAQRLHVLATVEILHRLLVSELRAPQAQILPLLWFQPLCIEILPPINQPTHAAPAAAKESPPPVERAFALHHCLLAPPLS